MNPDFFLRWFRYAINRVGPGYFGHAERVYCYELYHYIRVAMYHYEQEHGQLNEIFLHSELVKTVLSPNQAQRFDVWPLGGLKVPDFLFHTPGNFDNQIAAVEVKTAHLYPDNLINDLIKLTELRQNYRYHLGIFHCVNTNIGRLRALLNESDALAVGLDHGILIECKPGYGQMLQSCTLGELLT